MSLNRAIGFQNQIPWHIPEDFRWFKKMTTGKTIVMGRKTFESIGKPLPNRRTLVLSRTGKTFEGVETIRALTDLQTVAQGEEVFICGGAEIYAQALPDCSDLYLTVVKRNVQGNVFFPPFEHLFGPPALVQDQPEFAIHHYRRTPVVS